MADRLPIDISLADPRRHPAVTAWNQLTGTAIAPKRITRLNKGHTIVYRLAGIGPDGGSVIAKLCSRGDAEISQTISSHVLPRVPKPSLVFYGCLPLSGKRAWVFLEDAGSERCSLENPEHRYATSAWLAALHACLAGHRGSCSLPQVDLGMYLRKLRAGRRRILESLGGVSLDLDDLATLRSIVGWCDRIESQWDKLNALAADGPVTLVHGDFVPKNILVRQVGERLDVFPIDWETAGWGSPAADLGECPDLAAYAAEAHAYGPSWSVEMIRRLAALGKVLRYLVKIEWASWILARGWPPRAVRQMSVYNACLEGAVRSAAAEF